MSTLFLIALSSAWTGPLPSPSHRINFLSTSSCAFADETIFPDPSFAMYKVYCDLYKGVLKTVSYDTNLTYSIDAVES